MESTQSDNQKKIAAAHSYPGKLIVIEGTDGVGRSTHCQLLQNWMAIEGLWCYYHRMEIV